MTFLEPENHGLCAIKVVVLRQQADVAKVAVYRAVDRLNYQGGVEDTDRSDPPVHGQSYAAARRF